MTEAGSTVPPGAAYTRAGLASEHSAFQQTSAPAAASKGNSAGSIYDTPITKTNLKNMYEAPLTQTRPTAVADSLSSRGPPPPPPAPVAGASATELYGRGPPQPPPSVSSLPGLGGLPVTRPAAGTAAPRDGIDPPRESALPPRPAQPPAEPAASSSNPPPASSQGPLPPRPAAVPGETSSTPVASTPAAPPQAAAQPPMQRDSPSQRMFPSGMSGFPPYGFPPSPFGFGMQHPSQAGFGQQQQQQQAAQGTGGVDPYAPLTRCYQGLAAADTAPQGIGSEYFDKYRALTRDPSNSDYFRTDLGMAGREVNGVPPESMSLEEKISLTRNRDYLRIGLGLGLEGGPGVPPGVPPAAATATAALGGGAAAAPGMGQSGFGGGAFGANPLLGNYGQPNPYGGYGGLAAQGLGGQNPGYGGYPGAGYPGGLGGGLGAFGAGFGGQAGGYTQQPPRQGEVRGATDNRNPLGFGLSNSAGGPGGPGGLGGRTGNTPEDLRQRFKSF